MTTITVYNHKGGVAKTTTTVNLSCSLAQQGYRVAMIDLDAQAHLSTEFWDDYSAVNDIVSIIKKSKTQPIVIKSTDFTKVGENLWILPNYKDITEGLFYSIYPDENDSKKRNLILPNLLSELEDFDYLLIETPPNLENRSIGAILVADFLLIPTYFEKLSVKGIKDILEVLTGIQNNYDEFVNPKMGIVCTRVNRIWKFINWIFGQKLSNCGVPVLCNIYNSSNYAINYKNIDAQEPVYYRSTECQVDHNELAKQILKILK